MFVMLYCTQSHGSADFKEESNIDYGPWLGFGFFCDGSTWVIA
jgi:hypothetical protein